MRFFVVSLVEVWTLSVLSATGFALVVFRLFWQSKNERYRNPNPRYGNPYPFPLKFRTMCLCMFHLWRWDRQLPQPKMYYLMMAHRWKQMVTQSSTCLLTWDIRTGEMFAFATIMPTNRWACTASTATLYSAVAVPAAVLIAYTGKAQCTRQYAILKLSITDCKDNLSPQHSWKANST